MLLPLLLLLAAAQPVAGATSRDGSWPGPLLVIREDDAPEIIARLQPELDLVAIHVSVPVRDPPGAVSGATAHQELVRGRLAAAVARVGGRVELARGPTHAAYTVVGPAAEFPVLADALRQALLAPPVEGGELAAAWLRAEQRLLAELELPAARVRHSLWQRFGAANGADVALAAVAGPGELEAFLRHLYRPDRMRIVVVGGADEAAIRALFGGWRAPGRPGPPLAGRPVTPEGSPQLVAPWAGLAYDGRGIRPAALALAARLAGDALAAAAEVREARAELWLDGDARALVLVGGGARERGERPPRASEVADALAEALAAAAEGAGPAGVEGARRRLRRELVLAARTPQGLAGVIGDFADRTGDARAAARFLEELDDVDAEEVVRALRTLAARRPVTVEVAP